MLATPEHHPTQGTGCSTAVIADTLKLFLDQDRFVNTLRRIRLPNRRDPTYADSLRSLHSAILGLCALIESFPYSVEPWMPPLTEGMVGLYQVWCSPLTKPRSFGQPRNGPGADIDDHPQVCIRVQEGS